jgi:DNA mismatch repair ATPase MutS
MIQTDTMRTMFEQCKKDHSGAVLLFKIGDYLEAYYEDADLMQRVFGKY